MTRGSSTTDPILEAHGDRVDSRVAGLAGLPAGPELAAALADLDVAKLSDWELVEVLRARYRQASHDRGQLFAVLCEVTRRWQEQAMLRPEDPAWAWASSEVAAALVLSRGGADALCGLAWDLEDRLPEVGKALAAGVLDEPRARVFSDWTTWLDTAHAQAIVDVLLPKAPRLTTAQLRREIAKHAIA
ncbi:MAG TPA: DUF222 domain-containing protein, partial [Micromonosporaceae bacterium]|nr:DUF222 domain-containing protein [Micromonosporaceae bacterium]